VKSVQNLRNTLKFKAEAITDAVAQMVEVQPHILPGAARLFGVERSKQAEARAVESPPMLMVNSDRSRSESRREAEQALRTKSTVVHF
jgi:hypothetical protein